VDDGIVNGRTLVTSSAFAALRTDGSVVTWGASSVGGDSSAVASQINTNVLGFANEVLMDPLLIDVTQGNVNPSNKLPTGAVTIQSNTKLFTVGSVLTAANTIKDIDSLGNFTYQWQTNLGVLATSTSKTYTLTKNEVGEKVWVTVIYTDKLGTLEKVESSVTKDAVSISKKASIADDELTGNSKANKLSGGAGNDTLIGGLGKDTLTGGVGSDIFKFNAVNDTAAITKNADTITDFKSSEKDKIDLSAIDANSKLIGNQAFKFVSGTQFDSNLIGQIYFNSKDQNVYGTTSADNKLEFIIHLTGVTNVTPEDFIL
jgi:Ca2+-binding RTX toxin-like protein